jgi:phosphoenolpyruvate carboxylase
LNRDDIHFPPHHAPLREDIHALGEIVGSVLREQGGDELYELAEGDRRAAIRRREGTDAAAEALRARVEGRRPQLARATQCTPSPPISSWPMSPRRSTHPPPA